MVPTSPAPPNQSTPTKPEHHKPPPTQQTITTPLQRNPTPNLKTNNTKTPIHPHNPNTEVHKPDILLKIQEDTTHQVHKWVMYNKAMDPHNQVMVLKEVIIKGAINRVIDLKDNMSMRGEGEVGLLKRYLLVWLAVVVWIVCCFKNYYISFCIFASCIWSVGEFAYLSA